MKAYFEVKMLSEAEKVKKRLAELIALFYDCRKSRGLKTCADCDYWQTTLPKLVGCKYEKEHQEYWELLDKHKDIFFEGIRAVEPYLRNRPDLIKFIRGQLPTDKSVGLKLWVV